VVSVGDARHPSLGQALRPQQVGERVGLEQRRQHEPRRAVVRHHGQPDGNAEVPAVGPHGDVANHRLASAHRLVEAFAVHHLAELRARRIGRVGNARAVRPRQCEIEPIWMAAEDTACFGVERRQIPRFEVARRSKRAQRGNRTPELGVDRAHHRNHAVPGGVAHGVALLLDHRHGNQDREHHHRRRRCDRQEQ
jgi:hypothetical protein